MTKTPDPTRIVADTDVLAADVFIAGPAREAMKQVRTHSWIDLIVSDHLLREASEVITLLGDRSLADAWLDLIEPTCHVVEHPPQDHPALASAYAGEAGHLLTYDEKLTTARAGLSMRKAMPISIRTPDAFVETVSMEALFEATMGEGYPGPDVHPEE